jgi:hypothetical protein
MKFVVRFKLRPGRECCCGKVLYAVSRDGGIDTTALSRNASRFPSTEVADQTIKSAPLWAFLVKQGYEMDVLAKRF